MKRNKYLIVYLIAGILGFIIALCGCEKQNYLPVVTTRSINGKWIEKKFPQNTITITDSTIFQVGFPLVAGDDIRHKSLKCTYRPVINGQPRDSFRLNILSLEGDVLNLEIDNYFGTRDKVFLRIK